MEWVASTLHTTSEHGVSTIATADAQTSAASNRLNWRPRWFKWTRPFRRKTKSVSSTCVITYQLQSLFLNVSNRLTLIINTQCVFCRVGNIFQAIIYKKLLLKIIKQLYLVQDYSLLIRLTFRHRASSRTGVSLLSRIAFYIFNQQIYFIIWYLLDRASLI